MDKKISKNDIALWSTYAAIKALEHDLEYYRGNGSQNGNNADNGGNNFTPTQACKPAFIKSNPSFIGYLYAIGILFKKAFCSKKSNNLIVIR